MDQLEEHDQESINVLLLYVQPYKKMWVLNFKDRKIIELISQKMIYYPYLKAVNEHE